MSEISKLNRIVKLSSLILIAGILAGCVKPCQVDWARSCSEKQREVLKRDIEVNEYNERNSSNSKKENALN